MYLVLSAGNKELGRKELEPEKMYDDDYLGALRRLMFTTHELSIVVLGGHYEFYLAAESKAGGENV